MSKRKSKRRLDKETYLAMKKLKAEIRARPPRPISSKFRGVAIAHRLSPRGDNLGMALGLMASLMMQARIKKNQNFNGLPRRKRL